MELHYGQQVPRNPGDPRWFTGDVTLQPLVSSSGPTAKVLRVQFAPGARTNWHRHTGTQMLIVVEGHCLVQRRGGPIFELQVGDAVSIPPSEEHWHGASLGGSMTHLAINVEAETEWLAPVTDEEYAGR
jgi:quercetin dioxygenase-like cupin family protein